jgi:hypothetical protein
MPSQVPGIGPGAQPFDDQVQPELEGRLVRAAQQVLHGGEQIGLPGEELGSGGVRLLVVGVRQWLLAGAVGLGLPFGGRADDVGADREQRHLGLSRSEPGFHQHGEGLLDLGEALVAGPVSGEDPWRIPGGDQCGEHVPGVLAQPLPPRLAVRGMGRAPAGPADQLLGHQVHELPLVLDVPVQRRAGDAEARRDPPKAHRVEAALGEKGERGLDDGLAGDRRPLGGRLRNHA